MNNRKRMVIRAEGGHKFKDVEIWNLCFYMAKYILSGLKSFKKAKRMGYPGEVNPDEWEKILDETIWAFEQIKDDFDHSPHSIWFDQAIRKWKEEHGNEDYIRFEEDPERPDSHIMKDSLGEIPKEVWEEEDKYNNRVQEGLNLFAKYYLALWD